MPVLKKRTCNSLHRCNSECVYLKYTRPPEIRGPFCSCHCSHEGCSYEQLKVLASFLVCHAVFIGSVMLGIKQRKETLSPNHPFLWRRSKVNEYIIDTVKRSVLYV
jgi:hypothetical protein